MPRCTRTRKTPRVRPRGFDPSFCSRLELTRTRVAAPDSRRHPLAISALDAIFKLDAADAFPDAAPRSRSGLKFVLLALADSVDDESWDGAFPSVFTLAHRTGLSERAVQKNLRELQTLSLIHESSPAIVAARISTPSLRPQCYKLDRARIEALSATGKAKLRARRPGRPTSQKPDAPSAPGALGASGASSAQTPRTQCTNPTHPVHPNRTTNHQGNPRARARQDRWGDGGSSGSAGRSTTTALHDSALVDERPACVVCDAVFPAGGVQPRDGVCGRCRNDALKRPQSAPILSPLAAARGRIRDGA